MDYVNAINKGYESVTKLYIESIRTGKISEQDIYKMWCPYCGATAHIYHYTNGTMSFRCKNHRGGCLSQLEDEQENERLIVKKVKIYNNTTLNNELILYGNDRAPAIKPVDRPDEEEPRDDEDISTEENFDNTSSKDNDINELNGAPNVPTNLDDIISTPDEEERKEEAYYYEFGEKNIACTSSLFKEIKAHGHEFNMGDGRTAGDLLLDDIALHKIRREGFEGIKIALLTRPNKDDIKFLKDNGLYNLGGGIEYAILRDAYSTNPEDALFFKVKCKNVEQNDYFKDLVMGNKRDANVVKDPRQYIVIYAIWTRVANNYVSLYTSDITYRQYAFVKDIKIGK